MKKALIYAAGAVVYYTASALVLLILGKLFHVSFGNVWLSALPVTAAAVFLLLAGGLWKKRKKP